jgi:RecB family exonuclease
MKMSASRLKTYNKCPKQFKLRYVDGYEVDETSHYLVRGTLIHEFIEDFHDNVIIENGELVLDDVEYPKVDDDELAHLSQYKLDDVKQDIKTQCRQYIQMERRRWENLEKSTENPKYYFQPECTEIKLYDDNRNYVGIIDRVQRNIDGSYTIIDFKTGSIYSGKKNYRLQLAMYKHLLNHNDVLDGKIKEWGIISPKTMNSWLEQPKEKYVEKLHQDIKEVRKKIKNEKFDCPEGFTCMYCDDLYQAKMQAENPFNEAVKKEDGW